MSYTQSVSTARCEVADDFNEVEYITSLADFIANHIDDDSLDNDITWEFKGLTHSDVIDKLTGYIRVSGGNLLVEYDTEEHNQNTAVWDWLTDQVRQDVMTSAFMEISSATIDSRRGVECGTSYYMKDGRYIGSDDIMKMLEDRLRD